MKHELIAGRLTKKPHKYKHCPLESLVGKTVEAITVSEVEGPYDPEPCTVLFFTDGTQHGFVHGTDD